MAERTKSRAKNRSYTKTVFNKIRSIAPKLVSVQKLAWGQLSRHNKGDIVHAIQEKPQINELQSAWRWQFGISSPIHMYTCRPAQSLEVQRLPTMKCQVTGPTVKSGRRSLSSFNWYWLLTIAVQAAMSCVKEHTAQKSIDGRLETNKWEVLLISILALMFHLDSGD